MKHKIGTYFIKEVECQERLKEREDLAANINNLISQALKNSWPESYCNALYDLQKVMKIKGTYLELII